MEGRKEVRILIVDDREAWYDQVREYAEMNDHLFSFQVERSNTGLGAMEVMRQFEPTVVMIEAHLPDIDSFALVRQCRDQLTPVVVTSDENSTEIEESAFENGAQGYVVQTDNPDHLESLVLQLASLSAQKETTH